MGRYIEMGKGVHRTGRGGGGRHTDGGGGTQRWGVGYIEIGGT